MFSFPKPDDRPAPTTAHGPQRPFGFSGRARELMAGEPRALAFDKYFDKTRHPH
jgi:hypothetical protein